MEGVVTVEVANIDAELKLIGYQLKELRDRYGRKAARKMDIHKTLKSSQFTLIRARKELVKT